MTSDQISMEVRRILGLALKRPVAGDERPTREAEANWDSLKHVEILFMMEDSFGIEIPAEEMPTLNSFDALVQAVERHHAA
jgi:acyl carrier protein